MLIKVPTVWLSNSRTFVAALVVVVVLVVVFESRVWHKL